MIFGTGRTARAWCFKITKDQWTNDCLAVSTMSEVRDYLLVIDNDKSEAARMVTTTAASKA